MLSQYPQAVVLASASPRRLELLRQVGLRPIVEPANIDETLNPALKLEEALIELAERKANHVAKRYAANVTHFAPIIIGADTIVVSNGQIIGKPADAKDAAKILRSLSGRTHQVMTAVCSIDTNSGSCHSALANTAVKFRDLTEAEIAEYVLTGEAFGKAGAYAIQGQAAVFVEQIIGDYSNVVGLPLGIVYRLLHRINKGG